MKRFIQNGTAAMVFLAVAACGGPPSQAQIADRNFILQEATALTKLCLQRQGTAALTARGYSPITGMFSQGQYVKRIDGFASEAVAALKGSPCNVELGASAGAIYMNAATEVLSVSGYKQISDWDWAKGNKKVRLQGTVQSRSDGGRYSEITLTYL